MQFASPLVPGVLLRRYKRFLADIRLQSGEIVTAHTANTGAMTGCAEAGSRVWLSRSDNINRKYPYTWELVETTEGVMVGINTLHANRLVEEAIGSGCFPFFNGYQELRRELAYGQERSRIDLLLESPLRPPCYIEVKNVTLVDNGIACFPDAVSLRGQKHLRELAAVVAAGDRALLCFCVQRNDVTGFMPADHVDPEYGSLLRQVYQQGVDIVALQADPAVGDITLQRQLPVYLEKQQM